MDSDSNEESVDSADMVVSSESTDRVPATKSRGRARGRGRGRARGRPRGRGRGTATRTGESQSVSQTCERPVRRGRRKNTARQTEVDNLNRRREETLQTVINTLPQERMREMILAYARRDPIIMADVLEEQPMPAGASDPTPSGSTEAPWCVCLHCHPMPTEKENKCCGLQPVNCLSVRPDFDIVILDPQVLRVAMAHRNDLLAEENLANDASMEMVHRSYRHAAYRSFVLMVHGKLGAGDRRTIPSCCVLRIRGRYPDPNNQYVGFLPERL